MFALERRGIISSLGERVKIALPREILFTGRVFITETMMSILCSKSEDSNAGLAEVGELFPATSGSNGATRPRIVGGYGDEGGMGIRDDLNWLGVLDEEHLHGRDQGLGGEIMHWKAKEESSGAVDSKQQR